MELFLMSLRNVFRNGRRSILNIIALTIGIAIMFIAIGWVRGYFTVLYDGIINTETGHMQLLHEKYLSESRRLPLDLTVDSYSELRNNLSSIEGITAASGRINFSMELSNGTDSLRILGRGIDPHYEKEVTVLSDHITDGSYLTDSGGVLIGKPLAQKMNVVPGDTVYITAQDKNSVENFIDVNVQGLFDFGYPAMDENIVFIDLESAAFLLGLKNEVTTIVLKHSNNHTTEEMISVVKKSLSEYEGGNDIIVYRWQKFAQTLVSAVQADYNGFMATLVIIFILILLGILNSMSMSVHERVREIGTLRAIGMKKRVLFGMFMYESTAIALIAAVIALIVGGASALYLGTVGLDFAQYMPENMPIPFGERYTADFRYYDFVIGAGIGIGTALLGGLIPARRAVRLSIAKAMRTAHLE